MQISFRLLIAASFALFGLSFATSAASALRSIEVRGGERGVTASSVLTFGETGRAEGTSIICNVTLLRTVNRVISKIAGSIIGSTTGVAIAVETCRSGIGRVNEVTALRRVGESSCAGTPRLCTVSWPLVYDSFSGPLPEISAVNFHIRGAALRFTLSGTVSCLYAGEAFGILNVERRTIPRATANSAATRMARAEGSIFCPFAAITFVGNFTVRPTLTIALL